ncbi:PspA/IM30 family protein [Paenibacillaceae bacterium]|nr:PspA/IM30 family protein [Paenibacillaceae bacterium]
MNLLRRVRDMTVATMNDRLDKAEDPVKLIDRFLSATKQEIVQAEQLVAQSTAHSVQLKHQWQLAKQQAERREQQAITALRAEQETAARLALADKTAQDERAAQYEELYEQSKHTLLELTDQLDELKSEYCAVADKRQYYMARMETLRLQQRLNARQNGRQGGLGDPYRSNQVFQRLEDRMQQQEFESQSLRELRRSTGAVYPKHNPELDASVERELQELKSKLDKGGA